MKKKKREIAPSDLLEKPSCYVGGKKTLHEKEKKKGDGHYPYPKQGRGGENDRGKANMLEGEGKSHLSSDKGRSRRLKKKDVVISFMGEKRAVIVAVERGTASKK